MRQLLLQYLLPWLHNMELVDPSVPPANPLSYFQVSPCDPDPTRLNRSSVTVRSAVTLQHSESGLRIK